MADGLREGVAPDMKNTSYVLAAELIVPDGGADGVLVARAAGSRAGPSTSRTADRSTATT